MPGLLAKTNNISIKFNLYENVFSTMYLYMCSVHCTYNACKNGRIQRSDSGEVAVCTVQCTCSEHTDPLQWTKIFKKKTNNKLHTTAVEKVRKRERDRRGEASEEKCQFRQKRLLDEMKIHHI